ncbi:T9SS type A sorting domain-containing protein [Flavilitoribacter nigricans]|uniref:T9SS type A sorting domain-containing protein n=1 Tax=Flavilitoribacter nigricans TaxID=70997 RepID=UPI001472DB19|nr:T9SS type A sorting domain-containing protein [Flavilitoribacter nigricans]
MANFENRDILFLYNDQEVRLYAGIGGEGLLSSIDGGQTWERVNSEGHLFTPSRLLEESGKYYLTTLDKGVFESRNGIDFSPISDSLPQVAVWGITKYQGEWYVCTDKGVYRQDKKGGWFPEPLPETFQEETLYDIHAKAGLLVTGGQNRIYIKQDGSWKTIDFDFEFDIRNIVIFNDETIWVGTNGKGCYYSDDRGQSWAKLAEEGLEDNVIYLSKHEEMDLLRIGRNGLYNDVSKIGLQPEGIIFKTATFHRGLYFAGTVDKGIFALAPIPTPGALPINTENRLQNLTGALNIFPNPTDGTIWVQLETPEATDDIHQMEIFDTNGRLVDKGIVVAGDQNRFDLQLPPGVYSLLFSRAGKPVHRGRIIVMQ